jgi:DNA-binding LacI/PurR family transcriptional regulator
LLRLADSPDVNGVFLVRASGTRALAPHQRAQIDDAIAGLLRRKVCVVLVDRHAPTRLELPFVGTDNHLAGYRAAEYLLQRGHTIIGVLLGLRQNTTQTERLAGVQSGLKRFGVDYGDQLVRFAEEIPEANRAADEQLHGYRRGREKARELVGLPPEVRPTALICGASYLAVEALNAVHSIVDGLAAGVPDSYSLIAIDDAPELDMVVPGITRVPLPLEEIARRAVDLMQSRIEKPSGSAPERILVPPAPIVERQSVRSLR